MVNSNFFVLACLIMVWFPVFREPYATSHVIALLLFSGFSLAAGAFSGRAVHLRNKPHPQLLVLAALVWALATTQSLHPWESFQVGLIPWSAIIFYFTLPATIDLKPMVLIGVIESVVCLIQVFYGSFGNRMSAPAVKLLAAGTIGNPEYVAYFLGSVLLVLLCCKMLWGKRVKAALIALLVAGLAATGSRVAVICLCLSFGFLALWNAKTRVVRVLTIFCMVAVVISTLHFFPSAFSSFKGRILSSLSAGLVAFHSPLFGVGLGHLKYHYLQAQTFIIHTPPLEFLSSQAAFVLRAHNEFLDFFAEAGIMAMGLLLYFFYSLARKSMKWGQENNNSFALLWTLFTFFMSMFSFPFHILPNLILIVYIAAYIFHDQGTYLLRLSPVSRLALICLAGICTWQSMIIGLSEYYLNISIKAVQAGQNKNARETADAGLRWSSENNGLLLQKARLEYSNFESTKALSTLLRVSPTPCTVDAFKLRGLALQSLGQWGAAEENYLFLEKAFPVMVTPKYYLGRINLQKRKPEQAHAYFKSVMPLKAVNEKALFDRSFTFHYLNAR